MSKKDACYANGWCSGAVRPRLMDGPLEVTSGTGWSGFGSKNRRAAMPGWANVSGRKEQKTDLEKKLAQCKRRGSGPGVHGAFERVEQVMREQMCVGANICAGRLQDCGEIARGGDCGTSWG